ncbi:hypothetical protein BCR32DRAFT_270586 [Anaeromyces robustus]|uniref:Uncharacterized protein n=1 Tax=Anaeromyces robustus TaxID=1754192 RepID=A0A1Y1WVS1_9FUNG|nr:hypothetical protein BCR32DRAFT_270586 [Anaeromyces robustus]|eukprot:ORX77562.1 hypothetical protein BCR32DRAFT_270586 [Anaeromyces robustus]
MFSVEDISYDSLFWTYPNEVNQKIEEYICKLKSYYKFNDYQGLLNKLTIKDDEKENNKGNFLDKNDNEYNIDRPLKLQLKFNNLFKSIDEEIILAPINLCLNENLETKFIINLEEMAIPMFHVHLVKNRIHDDFIYVITGEEEGYIKDFIKRIRLLDNHIKFQIQQYIKNIQPTSPLYTLIKKYNVTETSNWTFTGIINGSNNNYLHISFKKKGSEDNIEGTPIYNGNELYYDMIHLLSLNSYCFVYGEIYPILKLKDIIVIEQIKQNKKILSFKSKAYFTEMFFKEESMNYTTKEKK